MWFSKALRRGSMELVETCQGELMGRELVKRSLSSLVMTISSSTNFQKEVKAGTGGFLGRCGLNFCPSKAHVEVVTAHVVVFGDGELGGDWVPGRSWGLFTTPLCCHVGKFHISESHH